MNSKIRSFMVIPGSLQVNGTKSIFRKKVAENLRRGSQQFLNDLNDT